jgi:plastocyanin
MSIRHSLAALAALASVALAAPAGAATPPLLTGSVGPSFTITLTHSGSKTKLATLRAGTYRITVSDMSTIHDFHLKGPSGFSRLITTVPFKGTKTITVTLKKGTYTYVCDPHAAGMHGSFKVT